MTLDGRARHRVGVPQLATARGGFTGPGTAAVTDDHPAGLRLAGSRPAGDDSRRRRLKPPQLGPILLTAQTMTVLGAGPRGVRLADDRGVSLT